MNIKMKLASVLAGLLLFFVSLAVHAMPTFIEENGNLRASAVSLDDLFGLEQDTKVVNSLVVPHASVQGKLRYTDDVDWFSFSGVAGTSVYLDATGLFSVEAGYMTIVELGFFDPTGTLLAWGKRALGGSTRQLLGEMTLEETGTYYAAISSWANTPIVISGHPDFPSISDSCSQSRELSLDGLAGGHALTGCTLDYDAYTGYGDDEFGDYILHISNSNSVIVSEPIGFTLFAFSFMGVWFSCRRFIGVNKYS